MGHLIYKFAIVAAGLSNVAKSAVAARQLRNNGNNREYAYKWKFAF